MALESRKYHHSTQNQKLHRTVFLDFFRKKLTFPLWFHFTNTIWSKIFVQKLVNPYYKVYYFSEIKFQILNFFEDFLRLPLLKVLSGRECEWDSRVSVRVAISGSGGSSRKTQDQKHTRPFQDLRACSAKLKSNNCNISSKYFSDSGYIPRIYC